MLKVLKYIGLGLTAVILAEIYLLNSAFLEAEKLIQIESNSSDGSRRKNPSKFEQFYLGEISQEDINQLGKDLCYPDSLECAKVGLSLVLINTNVKNQRKREYYENSVTVLKDIDEYLGKGSDVSIKVIRDHVEYYGAYVHGISKEKAKNAFDNMILYKNDFRSEFFPEEIGMIRGLYHVNLIRYAQLSGQYNLFFALFWLYEGQLNKS